MKNSEFYSLIFFIAFLVCVYFALPLTAGAFFILSWGSLIVASYPTSSNSRQVTSKQSNRGLNVSQSGKGASESANFNKEVKKETGSSQSPEANLDESGEGPSRKRQRRS